MFSGTAFPVTSCISLLCEFAALRALSKSHRMSGMLQRCVMNISIFGKDAVVVDAVSGELAHPWGAGGVISEVVLSDVLPVGTGLLPLVPLVITVVPADVVCCCVVISSAF